MLVKEIILKACFFTENEETYKAIDEGEQLSEENAVIKDKLLKCFNLIRNEIASEYIRNEVHEEALSKGKVEFSKLSAKPIEIICVKNANGNNVKFVKFDSYILTESGKLTIIYNAFPKELNLEDEFDSTIPAQVYAYGVVKEYFFIQTLYEDAQIWDERFKNSLEALARKKRSTISYQRRWI